ncbi:GLPGLI family protein [Chryseobacterium shandongense]|uniref:GLPGLI family protein n=1 Tax=Chryseobacterium shandongense TaxID=1493872 RepID=UPI000F4E1C25|nr:GLPGLI family protein [Chryseobacterium shandongense]AZA59010.1 GLPGLI family protein [Chryseobacterium shandongense]
MKTLYFIILLAVSVTAQTHRFVYDVVYRPDSASIEIRKANYYLDINPDETFYYERPFFVSDSIEKASGLRTFSGKANDLMSKKIKTREYTLYSIQSFDIYQLKDEPKISWKIEKETKKTSSLQLQKATAKFGGRNWIAWFSKDIPFQEGPYKFYGLPGLIVEIYDDNENYHFSLNKSENFTETQFISFYKNAKARGVEILYSKYQSMLLSYYHDPIKFINSGQIEINEDNKLALEDGRIIYKPEELRQYAIEEQQRIKKYNNPIELDKAVRYPEIKK